MMSSRPTRHISISASWLLAIAGVLGCTQAPVIVPGAGGSGGGTAADGGASSGPAACVAAGGTCVIGPALGCSRIGTQDCNPTRNPGGAVCCLDGPKVCDEDGGVANIASADYDRSCSVDTDCVAVSEGNVCLPCLRMCPAGVVNQKVVQQYRSDLAQLSDPDPEVECHCPAEFVPCCIAGQCHADPVCGQPH
jgi:hypothetical protein